MDILSIGIAIILFLAFVGIVTWFMGKVSLPQPVSIVIYAGMAILGLVLLASLAGYGPHLAIR